MVPESDLVDWLTWPIDQLLRIGGVIAAWFFGEDATGFTLVQMGFATLVLAILPVSLKSLVLHRRLRQVCRYRDGQKRKDLRSSVVASMGFLGGQQVMSCHLGR